MKKYNYTALLLCAIACCGWGYALALRYYRLEYTGWDLPLYANLMWNLCHGSLSTMLFKGDFLRDHFNAIAFLLVPFYYFFQSALTLLYFKLLAFFAGAYIFYLLASRRFGGGWAIAFMLAYMFYPANVNMILFEFNFENLALPLIFLLFYYFEEKKFASFMACCFLLTMVKENMPLVVLMFGIYGFVFRRKEGLHWALFPFLLGAGMFIAEVFVIIPWPHPGFSAPNVYWREYSELGTSPTKIARAFISREPEIFKILFNGRNLSFLSQLFGPLIIPAFLAPQVLLIATPLFLQDLLSLSPGQHSIEYFYASTLTVFIFMAAIVFLGRISARFKTWLCLIILCLLFLFDAGYVPKWLYRVAPFDEKQAVSQYFLSQIPANVPVMSSGKFMSILSQRKELYGLFLRHRAEGKIVPEDVDYAAVDFSSGGLDRKFIEKNLLDRWGVQAAADETVVLRKNVACSEKLIESADRSLYQGPQTLEPEILVDDALKMEGLEVPKSLKFGQRVMRIVFYWEALKDDNNRPLPSINLSIFQGPGRFYFKKRSPFYGLPLKKGKHYRENFYYLIPKLSPGEYSIIIFSIPSKASSASVYTKNISVLLN